MQNRLRSKEDLEALRKEIVKTRQLDKPRITVCGGTGCQASQSRAVIDALKSELVKQGDLAIVVDGVRGIGETGEVCETVFFFLFVDRRRRGDFRHETGR